MKEFQLPEVFVELQRENIDAFIHCEVTEVYAVW
jgi:hypothetical protein